MSSILYISSEAFPLIKTGGLGDVAGSLPAALQKKSQDIRLLLPAYPEVLSKINNPKVLAETSYYNLPVTIIETTLPGTNVKTLLIECPSLFDRPGGPYTDSQGNGWHNNALRFAVFCHAAVDISLNQLDLNWKPDIVHCNDWQTGLVPALLSLQENRPATIFTIHNLAYQGIFDQQTFYDLHMPDELWHMEGVEFYNQLSFIKAGIAYADKITTVSHTYAGEICQPENGYGLDGLLTHRSKDLVGILNGIDEKYWNPGTDKYLDSNYNRRTLEKKSINKTALQEAFDLPIDSTIPMLGMVSRLVEQKGLNIILPSLPSLIDQKLQIVILGTGDLHYEMKLSELAQQHPNNIVVKIGYNESLAHKIEAASDMYLMPSSFEPCGLNQLYSLRYGTLPIVNKVGGLADTVVDATDENINQGIATGFVLSDYTATALTQSINKATDYFARKETWKQLQLNAMDCNHSWDNSADHYIKLYELALNLNN